MKNNIAKREIEFFELKVKPDLKERDHTLIPLNQIAAYGLVFEPLFTKGGKSGLYYAKVPAGGTMHKKKGSGNYIGSVHKDKHKNNIFAQTDFVKLPVDPLALVIALSLSQIDNKLSEIKQTQENILNYLIKKDKAVQRGNLLTLIGIENELKDFWKNNIYRQNKHILVQEIKRESEQKLIFEQNAINEINSKNKSFIINNNMILNRIEVLNEHFKEYNLANYIYAYSSYLEVLLLGDFSDKVIRKTSKTISDNAYEYRQFYTQSYTLLEKQVNKAIESTLFSGFSEINRFLDKVSDKLPTKINKESAKDNKVEKYLENSLVRKTGEALKGFSDNKTIETNQFSSNLDKINDTYNQEQSFYVDKDNIYLLK